MWFGGPRFEFRVELTAQEPWMVLYLDYLHQFSVGAVSADLHPQPGNDSLIGIIEFIPVPVSFGDLLCPVSSMRKGLFLYDTRIGAQAHRAALLSAFRPFLYLSLPEVIPFFHKINNRSRGIQIEFRTVCIQPADV